MFLIWVQYLGFLSHSLFGFLILATYSCSLFMFLIHFLFSNESISFLIQAPSLGSIYPFFRFFLFLIWIFLVHWGSLDLIQFPIPGIVGLNSIQSCYYQIMTIKKLGITIIWIFKLFSSMHYFRQFLKIYCVQ